METHRLHEELFEREVKVLVVGCGGTASAILGGLPYLHLSMLAQGHPYELSSYDELVQKALMTLNYKIGSFLADNCPGTLAYHSQEACPDGERAHSW